MNEETKKKNKLRNVFSLFIKFFKIGAFTFGGGYAMISLIHAEIVDRMKWLDNDEMINLTVIAQSTPGVLAVNVAVFVGYKVAGVAGSVMSTVGVSLPPLIVIGVINLFYDAFKSFKYIDYAFVGVRAGVILLIFNAIIKIGKNNKKDAFYIIVLGLTIIISLFFKINAIYMLLATMILGVLYTYIFLREKK